MRSWVIIASLVALAGVANAGEARAAVLVEYYGPHPIDSRFHSGLCVIEGPHMHSYEPSDEVLYVHDGPYWTFVGDPTEVEPVPTRYAYYGHHPVWWTHAPGEYYCYITGPHYHAYAPPAQMQFTDRGGVYWYVGVQPVWYERHKHRKHSIDDYYHDHVIVRPVVAVAPPAGWVGVTFGVGPVGVEIGVPFGRPAPMPVMPVIIEHEDHVIIERDDHHHPPAWGHHKDDPRFPGKHGNHGKDKHR